MDYIFSFLQILEAPEQHKNCSMKLKFSIFALKRHSVSTSTSRVGEDPGNEVFPSYLCSSGISKKGEGTFLHSQLYTTSPESVHIRL